MEKQEFKKLCKNYKETFVKIIKESDTALAFDDVDADDIGIYLDDKDEIEELYCELNYQIDDRKWRDEDVLKNTIKEKLAEVYGEDFGVSLRRMDAYPNGYAHYNLTIDYMK